MGGCLLTHAALRFLFTTSPCLARLTPPLTTPPAAIEASTFAALHPLPSLVLSATRHAPHPYLLPSTVCPVKARSVPACRGGWGGGQAPTSSSLAKSCSSAAAPGWLHCTTPQHQQQRCRHPIPPLCCRSSSSRGIDVDKPAHLQRDAALERSEWSSCLLTLLSCQGRDVVPTLGVAAGLAGDARLPALPMAGTLAASCLAAAPTHGLCVWGWHVCVQRSVGGMVGGNSQLQ